MIRGGRQFLRVLGRSAERFYWDDSFSRACALSYNTLFALVPIAALSFSVMGKVFGVDDSYSEQLIKQILPPLQDAKLEHLQLELLTTLRDLIERIGSFNTVSLAALVITGITLLNTIESALNVIWRVSSNLSVVGKITSFWTVISLGPLLVVWSLIWTTMIERFIALHLANVEWLLSILTGLVPVFLMWCAVTLLYVKLPAARVRFRDAALGGLVAAVLFESAKGIFTYYVSLSSTYSTLSGVLVSIPLFLFWLYVIWVVILFGAEISYQSGARETLSGRAKYSTDLGEIGAVLGLRLLQLIGQSFRRGERPPSEGELAVRTGAEPTLVRRCLDLLTEARLLTISDPETHTRSLLVSPEKLRLSNILDTFLSRGSKRGSEGADLHQQNFLETLRGIFGSGAAGETPVRDWSLQDFLADTPDQAI